MKKSLIALVVIVLTVFLVNTVFAAKNCPQKRKTKKAPSSIYKMDKTKGASVKSGKAIYMKKAKPLACVQCHGKKGKGDGKLGKAFKPGPRNFACKKTMKKVTPGQMFWIIKNGSKKTGMTGFKKTLKDKQIWDVIKYIRKDLMK